MNSSEQIKTFILDNLSSHQRDIIQEAITRFGISRQAVHKHMNRLIDNKMVIAHGTTRGRYYKLNPLVNFTKAINIDENYSTEKFLNKNILPHFSTLAKNVFEIFNFSSRALISNVIYHSMASKFYIKIYIIHSEAHFIISDNGIGIFKNIQSGLNLHNAQLAVLELAKGNHITTDSDKHSGDELNAIIQLFDKVMIDSSGLSLEFTNENQNWRLNQSVHKKGTKVHLIINPSSNRTCAQVFNRIFNQDQKNVRIPLNLLEVSKYKIVNSRNYAKSVLRNIYGYKKIEFDFNNIDLIGPAFADELIRNAVRKNQQADIKWINTNETVDLLLSRALNRIAN